MLDNANENAGFHVAAYDNPFHRASYIETLPQGVNLQTVVESALIPENMRPYIVVRVSIGLQASEVAAWAWPLVRPKSGAIVEVFPRLEGAGAAALLTAVVGAAAPTIAAGLFPKLAAGSFLAGLATAAVSVVGTLLVRALIPPAQQSGGESGSNFNITGTSNTAQPYEPYPTVLGRRRYFAVPTAQAYTETVDGEVYLRQRMTFGHGPIMLEDLRIGTTPITEFDGVEIECLNIHRDLTEAAIDGIGDLMYVNSSEKHAPNFGIFDQRQRPHHTGYVFEPREKAGRVTLTFVDVNSDKVQGLGGGSFVTISTFEDGSDTASVVEEFELAENQELSWASPDWTDDIHRTFKVTAERNVTLGVMRGTYPVVNVVEANAAYQEQISTSSWRYGSERMTLVPNDVASDTYSVLLEDQEEVVRETRNNIDRAEIDFGFQGLVRVSENDGGQRVWGTDIDISYREVGATAWIFHERKRCEAKTRDYIRFTSAIEFPETGTYEIRLVNNVDIGNFKEENIFGDANLTTIRSIKNGELPSHEGISEIAIRIKATDELNGSIDSLNAVVQMLGRVWDGSGWSDLQPIRHPAWLYAHALTGPMLRDPLDENRIDLEGLRAWAEEEPHWTCDLIIEGTVRLAEVLGLIAATGRATSGLVDTKFGVIRDGAAGGIVQHFSPRNTWGFEGQRYLDREIHAFRVRVVSEDNNWEQTEYLVYADGHDENSATEIETLEVAGTVITSEDEDGGNAYRLGRYHLAVATLRAEEFSFYSDLDHLLCQRGDKIRIVHDVPQFGVGSARVSAIEANDTDLISLKLDDVIEVADQTYRMVVRTEDGGEVVFAAQHHGEGVWTPTSIVPDGFSVGDFVLIEETSQDSVDLLITSIEHEDELTARVHAVPAAPAVLKADSEEIGVFDPQITTPVVLGPARPTIQNVRSSSATSIVERDGSLTPRIGVQITPPAGRTVGATQYQIRWSYDGDLKWQTGGLQSYADELFTDALIVGEQYTIGVRSVDVDGKSQGWVNYGPVQAVASSDPLPAPTNWTGRAGVSSVTLEGETSAAPDFAKFVIYGATDDAVDLTVVGYSGEPYFNYSPSSIPYTRYKVASVDHGGDIGATTAFINVTPTGVTAGDLSEDVANSIGDAQAAADQAIEDAEDAAADALAAAEDALAAKNLAEKNGDDIVAEAQEREAQLAAVEAQIAPLFPSVPRLPASSWEYLPNIFQRTPPSEALFITDDPDFGECFEFPNDGNLAMGPSGFLNWDADRVYRVTFGFKVVDDGDDNGCRITFGANCFTASGTPVQVNVQATHATSGNYPTVADGVQYVELVVASRASVDSDFYQHAILNRTNFQTGNKVSFHIRQNAAAFSNAIMRIGSIQVEDITALVDAKLEADAATAERKLAAQSASDSLGAANASIAAKDAAISTANDVETTAQAVNQDKVAAETAKSGAEAARSASVTAKETAESAASTASDQRQLATQAATAASGSAADAANSASSAATSKTDAESAASSAVDQKGLAATAANHASDSAAAASNSATDAATAKAGAEGAEASALASSEIAARIGSRGGSVFDSTLFQNEWDNFGLAPEYLDSTLYATGRKAVFTSNGTSNTGASIRSDVDSAGWTGAENADAYVLELEMTLISGSFNRDSGVFFDWRGASVHRRSLRFDDHIRQDITLGKPFTFTSLVTKPSSADGSTFLYNQIYLLGSWNGFGPQTEKQFEVHSVRVRVATDEELGIGEVGEKIGAAVSEEAAVRASETGALATRATNLETSVGGLTSSVTSQGTAISDLEGKAQASFVLAVKAGTSGAELDLVAANDPDGGNGSSARISADNILLDGSVDAKHIKTGSLTADRIKAGELTLNLFSDGQLQTALYPTEIEVITTSQNWSPNRSGLCQVWVIGGGGSGAVNFHGGRATGGGGAGCAVGFIPNADISQSAAITIGAGGASTVVTDSNGGSRNGSAGGATTFVGFGLNMLANGGGGGVLTSDNNTNGGVGGGAQGGAYNHRGGTARPDTTTGDTARGGAGASVSFGLSGAPQTGNPANTVAGNPLRGVPSGVEVSGVPIRGYADFGGSVQVWGDPGIYDRPSSARGGFGAGSGGVAMEKTGNRDGPAIAGAGGDGVVFIVYYRQGNLK